MTTQDTYHAFMLDYAAGNLAPSLKVAASIHRLMSSCGDEAATLWESVREVLLEDDANPGQKAQDDAAVSAALDIIHMDYEEVRWRRGLSGVRYSNVSSASGQLMRLEPGQNVFAHGHSALEATVILEGALEDGHGSYQQGDILFAIPGVKHRPAALGQCACTCYVARSPRPFWRLT